VRAGCLACALLLPPDEWRLGGAGRFIMVSIAVNEFMIRTQYLDGPVCACSLLWITTKRWRFRWSATAKWSPRSLISLALSAPLTGCT